MNNHLVILICLRSVMSKGINAPKISLYFHSEVFSLEFHNHHLHRQILRLGSSKYSYFCSPESKLFMQTQPIKKSK